MNRFIIGQRSDARPAEFVGCDVARLLRTRLLIQANSGAGKSWCLRRILEQTHGQVQQIIIDPEGEFATLRERHDYVLAAPTGGDTVAHPRSAELLALKLLELGVSAVLDIFELKAHERVAFVKRFIAAMMEAPKKLWRPALIVLDEAHIFCPEKDQADSAGAVIDLCTRGRKRGFCPILATQRLAKLNKNAAAELNNKLIGRTSLDVDMKRAGDELGFGKAEQPRLRTLPDGNFFAFGPAISDTIVAVHVGAVETSHPEAGRRASSPPPPTAKVRALLPQLADLPAEADERARSIEDLRADNTRLKRELAAAKKAAPGQEVRVVEKPMLTAKDLRRVESIITKLAKAADDAKQAGEAHQRQGAALLAEASAARDAISRFSATASQPPPPLRAHPLEPEQRHTAPRPPTPDRRPPPAAPRASAAANGGPPLKKCARAQLAVLAQHPEGCSIEKIALLTGYRISGGFKNDLAALRTHSLMTGDNGGVMQITDDGLACGPFAPLPMGRDLIDFWRTHRSFKKCARAVLAALIDHPDDGLTIDEIATETGYAVSGGFKNDLAVLRTAGVMVGKNTDRMRLSDELLEALR